MAALMSPDRIRGLFAEAMSRMYQAEVPHYGTLLDLVAEVNAGVPTAEAGRIAIERHGAIRLGTAAELAGIRRLFAVMGMVPVGYYDLSVAGVPVHSTCFRPVEAAALAINPFRVFTSLLRLELIDDAALRAEAEAILGRRRIFTPRALALIDQAEHDGGLTAADAKDFVAEALETFRWHHEATVSAETYHRLNAAHRLVADVVCFRGPHINHLTPRTLDIDAVQRKMPERGITPKAVIEGPPRRRCDILLRQTSFKALEEPIAFVSARALAALTSARALAALTSARALAALNGEDRTIPGTHTARFGEVEQRGAALTATGRALYDRLLAAVRADVEAGATDHDGALAARFGEMPDTHAALRGQGLAFYRYTATARGMAVAGSATRPADIDRLIAEGHLECDPIVYEDFLPVSAAGIFQSNLGGDTPRRYATVSNRTAFEEALGAAVIDELALYAETERESLDRACAALRVAAPIPATRA